MTTPIAQTAAASEVADPTRRQLARVRWAVRAVLILGVAASLAANMLHAEPNNYSRTIAAWPPLALFATIEVISRVPINHAWLAATRVGATIAIGTIAAWVSYWHMAAVVAHYGEHGATPYLLPFSVDGLVIVASISLFELGARIRDTSGRATGAPLVGATVNPPPMGVVAEPRAAPTPPAPRAGADHRNDGHRGSRVADADGPAASTGREAPARTRHASPADVAEAVHTLRLLQPPLDAAEMTVRVGRSKRQVQRLIRRLDAHTPPARAVNGNTYPADIKGEPS